MIKIRCRGPTGQFTLSELTRDSTFHSLQEQVAKETGLRASRQEFLVGYPPKPLQSQPDAAATLGSIGISNGDSIVIRELAGSKNEAAATEPAKSNQEAARNAEDLTEDEQFARALAISMEPGGGLMSTPDLYSTVQEMKPAQPLEGPNLKPSSTALPDGSVIVRRVIDSDNSCLFNAVGYVMERSRKTASQLRKIIADAVASDQDTYSEAFLGKTNVEYQRWILDPLRWGGAIELSILARHFGRVIAAYDIQTKRIDLYGEDQSYSERVMVVYDGLHYDALAQAAFEGAPEELDVTVFDIGGATGRIEHAAARLVAKLHDAKQFTDTASFTLRCGDCKIGVTGEKEALQHAKQTGHQNFVEYQ